ncbi:uncharacterized protein B0H18DRAFT_68453 [Fomitopsis serialis]|uniref:uncharacterized protein n=1 Tax=Fomitopsis serialis TaxID=139415 RepID=UPI0020080F2C|nr:uncharacterized protein B0H18DRAFT_68453 [Neoantrodia serialis]KAH9931869.1 hypothetical protein B0H18DRAFT_68453 [Neoantrodia serialis]
MLEHKLGIEEAIAMLFRQHVALQERFLKAYHAFEPRWGPATNEQLREALRDLANFPRGIYCWHFEGGRYFGTKARRLRSRGACSSYHSCLMEIGGKRMSLSLS